MENFKVKLLREDARLPYKATAGAAAYDLYSANAEDIVLKPGEYAGVPSGIAIELPSERYVALVFSRSGHGVKHGVSLSNSVGVIDSDYRGEITVGLINHGHEPFTVSHGDRIAQLMIIELASLGMVESDELCDTERGAGGFGSTGR
ncbi:MAG: dUTP diphosphatase [Ruminococcaceae bacterium]|nr:dUTP diphosphatase [Oscillospiraceae bacterium]